MVLHLAEQLDVPLRDRNQLLLAAGYAPVYGQRELDEPGDGAGARRARPRAAPATSRTRRVVVDRHWGMVAANRAVGAADRGRRPRTCSSRRSTCCGSSLHPEGLAPRIVNLGEWRAHLLDRLGRQAVATGDPALAALHDELAALPRRPTARAAPTSTPARSPSRCGSPPATPSSRSSAR